MAEFEKLKTHVFDVREQMGFAALSGDRNPMHLDPVAARRTQAGVPVVHGINALLWALDCLAEKQSDLSIAGVEAKFQRFIPVGQAISLWAQGGTSTTKLEIRADGGALMKFTLLHASTGVDSSPSPDDTPTHHGPASPRTDAPIPMEFEDSRHAEGVIELLAGDGAYPSLEARIGQHRVAAMIALSYLVGMVVPGMDSIFASLDASFLAERTDTDENKLAYQVVDSHDLFRLLTIATSARGLRANVLAFMRPPPVSQPSAAELGGLVKPGDYAHVKALVVGGSRGLGEIVAKLLAAGGAHVVISYVVGIDDAKSVAADINAIGGRCNIVNIDVTTEISTQLEVLPFIPNQLYYFATTKIFLQEATLFSPRIFDQFRRIYVDAFAELCQSLVDRTSGELLAFYPSSVAIDERPRAMTEYSMAKAAAEILCADMERFIPRLRILVRRLPRLLTDQTASVTPVETPPAAEVMLEVVNAMTHVHR